MGKPSGNHLPKARQPRKKLQRHSLGLFPKILIKQPDHALKVFPTVYQELEGAGHAPHIKKMHDKLHAAGLQLLADAKR